MKNKIKDFLFKKRIKILKSKKGFSLLEVLIAVGIIAIISAIAVPQYTANKKEAATVAGDASISNIMKAYNHCIALKSADDCNSLEKLNVTCPDCKSENGASGFCVHIKKDVGNEFFAACVQIKGDVITRSYGGALIKEKICHVTIVPDGTCTTNKPKTNIYPIKKCTAPGDCGNNVAKATNVCGVTYGCTDIGVAATSGTCSNAGACQF